MNRIDIDLYEIIPQRPPMVMIDSLTVCNETTTTTCFTITDECIFNDNGMLSGEGMLENIAQTCAARIGYINHLAGHTVKLGFIGAVKSFKIIKRPRAKQTITTTIVVKEEIFGITLVDAFVQLDEEVIATTSMKIALSDIDAQK